MKIYKVVGKPFSGKTNLILDKSKECLENDIDYNIIITGELTILEVFNRLIKLESNLKSYLVYEHNPDKSITAKIEDILNNNKLNGKINIYILGVSFIENEIHSLRTLKKFNIDSVYFSKQLSISLSGFYDKSNKIEEYII